MSSDSGNHNADRVEHAANGEDSVHVELGRLERELASARAELRLEAALERVRARAMAMQHPDELRDVVASVYAELRRLDFDIERCIIWIFEPETLAARVWMSDADQTKLPESYHIPFHDHPTFQAYIEAWKSQEQEWVYELSGDLKNTWDNVLFTETEFSRLPEFVQEAMRAPEQIILTATFTKFGAVQIAGLEPLETEKMEVLKRFGRVLDLTYTRFDDLKRSEAQTREAKIETSLERVRGRAMAMQEPENLNEVSILMFDELSKLGISSLRSGISIPLDNERYEFRAATKKSDGTTTLVVGNESINVHPIIRRAFDGFSEQEEFQKTILKGDDLVEYYHAVFDTMPLPDWKERMETGAGAQEGFATFPFSDGWLYTFTREEMDDEQINVFIRFAKVFGLAYQRYHDLKKAEKDYQALLAEKARTERALEELHATQAQLIEQEKLASLGSLTAGIAHEIKNPLNFVNNFAEVSTELIEELSEAVEKGNAEEAQTLLGEITKNATQIAKHGKRADSIVRAMMQHAKGGVSEMEEVELNIYLDEYANLAWHGMRARDHGFQVDVERSFDPNVGSISVMPQELGRVILNLFNNAFDALREVENALVTIGTRALENEVEITVSDNGPGIPADIREKIFEPFFTTKATGEGTGLGLSLSYDIVTKGHGGKMRLEESPDGGAMFVITLPA